MTTIEAQSFGRKKTLKATAIAVAFMISMLLIGETRGDFANGILFFMQALLNIHIFFILTILFGSTYIFGGKAGVDIIIEKKNVLLTTLKYVFLISILLSIYTILIGIIKSNVVNYNNLGMYFITSFFKPAISMLLVWLWATSKMKTITKNAKEEIL